jgi:hypothetical protein
MMISGINEHDIKLVNNLIRQREQELIVYCYTMLIYDVREHQNKDKTLQLYYKLKEIINR